MRLADGRVFRGKAVVSNATRWDTFEKLMQEEQLPPSEKAFRDRYKKSPSFLSIHMGVKASALPAGNPPAKVQVLGGNPVSLAKLLSCCGMHSSFLDNTTYVLA